MPHTEPIVTPPSRAVLLINRRSRRGKEWMPHAQAALEKRGMQLEFVYGFRTVRELIGMTREALASGVPYVIAGGGDGTFSAITHLFVNQPAVLGVLPMGTGNALARDLGIPPEMDRAADILTKGTIRAIDVGAVDADYFVNVATIGLTTKIAECLTVDRKRKWGRLVYLYAVARALTSIRPFTVRVETENGIDEFRTMQVVLGNGRYHAGPFLLGKEAQIDEGKLTLYALKAETKGAFIRFFARLTRGEHESLPEVHSEATVGGRILTTPQLPVTVDGEVCLRTPIEFRVQPKALRVVVPAVAQADDGLV